MAAGYVRLKRGRGRISTENSVSEDQLDSTVGVRKLTPTCQYSIKITLIEQLIRAMGPAVIYDDGILRLNDA
jgi:hypothetical protein